MLASNLRLVDLVGMSDHDFELIMEQVHLERGERLVKMEALTFDPDEEIEPE